MESRCILFAARRNSARWVRLAAVAGMQIAVAAFPLSEAERYCRPFSIR